MVPENEKDKFYAYESQMLVKLVPARDYSVPKITMTNLTDI